jgi:hypothetical protein
MQEEPKHAAEKEIQEILLRTLASLTSSPDVYVAEAAADRLAEERERLEKLKN